MTKNDLTILVLGGMGSRASTSFLKRAYDHLVGYDDHNLPRVILDNSSDIPSRGLYFAGKGPDPTPAMIERMTHYKKNFRLSAIYVPCNTAHLLFDRLPDFHQLWVHLPNTIITTLKAKGYKKVLVVGSTASTKYDLYRGDEEIQIDHASTSTNTTFVKEIYDRKKGLDFKSDKHLLPLSIISDDYDAILLACTELEPFNFNIPIISSIDLYSKHLAEHMLKFQRAK
jgi:aspartate/glutamate racemase